MWIDRAGRLLVVDDDAQVRTLLASLLTSEGYAVDSAASAEEAEERLAAAAPDLVLLDLHLPGKSGLDFLAALRDEPSRRLLPVVMLTGEGSRDEKLQAIRTGITEFLTKPFDPGELAARVRSLVQLKFFTDELEEAERVIVALARAVDARDPYTAAHSERVSRYATRLGERIGLTNSDLAAVRRGGLFHDLGKISVPDAILRKPRKLTRKEFDEIKKHPVQGRELIRSMKSLAYALPVVYHHHEKFDGSGYPDGLSGESIPLVARVATLADVYDALSSARPYRGALTRKESLAIMESETRKGWWDRRLFDEFKALSL